MGKPSQSISTKPLPIGSSELGHSFFGFGGLQGKKQLEIGNTNDINILKICAPFFLLHSFSSDILDGPG